MRAAVLSGGTSEGRTYALTATALVAIGALAGFRLPLARAPRAHSWYRSSSR